MKTAIYRCMTPKCKGTHNLSLLYGETTDAFCYEENGFRKFKRVRGTTVDSVKLVRFNRHNASFAVDTEASELDIRAACRVTFANPRGHNERYVFYRGCLIVRHTMTFTGCKPERLTIAYLFGRWPKGKTSDLFIAGPDFPEHLTGIAHAKRHLDAILDSGKCWQDLQEVKP